MGTSEMSSNVLKNKCEIKQWIEIPMLINLIAINISGPVVSNILLHRTCVNTLKYTEAECEPFLSPNQTNQTQKLEEEVQAYKAYVITVKNVLEYIGPAILSLFVGAWSATYGRKPLIIWPIFGMTVTGILNVIFSMTASLGPWWYVATAIPFSMTGGYVVMYTGAYSYISDITRNQNSLLRTTTVNATISLGQFIGSFICFCLILTIGHNYLLLLAASFHMVAYCYLTIIINESLAGASQGGVREVFNLKHVKKMFVECTKVRPSHGRAQIMLISIVKALSVLVIYGTGALEYMYTRQKLLWALREYNIYSCFKTVTSFVGELFGSIVIPRLLGIGNISFSIFTLITANIEFTIKMFASTSLDIYISSLVAMFKNLLGPLMICHLNTILTADDVAVVQAFMGAAETISPILAPLTFNTLYAATVAPFPGAIYLLSIIFTSITAVLLCFVLHYTRTLTQTAEQSETRATEVEMVLISRRDVNSKMDWETPTSRAPFEVE